MNVALDECLGRCRDVDRYEIYVGGRNNRLGDALSMRDERKTGIKNDSRVFALG